MKKYILSICFVVAALVATAQYNNHLKIEKLLATDTTTLGQKIVYPQFDNQEVTMLKITFPPGESTGWHKHEIPVFAYVLKGTLTVELEDHTILKLTENSSFAESFNTYHNGSNRENSDLVLIAIYLGHKGQKLSIPKME